MPPTRAGRALQAELERAPSLLKHLLGDMTLTAVGALIFPNVRELSGLDEWGF